MPAAAVAQSKAVALGVADRARFVVSDWTDAVTGRYDMIVANPPYLSDAEVAETAPEVRSFEPHGALSSGVTGLEALDRIIAAAKARLAPGGWLICETGIAQHATLLERLRAAG